MDMFFRDGIHWQNKLDQYLKNILNLDCLKGERYDLAFYDWLPFLIFFILILILIYFN